MNDSALDIRFDSKSAMHMSIICNCTVPASFLLYNSLL